MKKPGMKTSEALQEAGLALSKGRRVNDLAQSNSFVVEEELRRSLDKVHPQTLRSIGINTSPPVSPRERPMSPRANALASMQTITNKIAGSFPPDIDVVKPNIVGFTAQKLEEEIQRRSRGKIGGPLARRATGEYVYNFGGSDPRLHSSLDISRSQDLTLSLSKLSPNSSAKLSHSISHSEFRNSKTPGSSPAVQQRVQDYPADFGSTGGIVSALRLQYDPLATGAATTPTTSMPATPRSTSHHGLVCEGPIQQCGNCEKENNVPILTPPINSVALQSNFPVLAWTRPEDIHVPTPGGPRRKPKQTDPLSSSMSKKSFGYVPTNPPPLPSPPPAATQGSGASKEPHLNTDGFGEKRTRESVMMVKQLSLTTTMKLELQQKGLNLAGGSASPSHHGPTSPPDRPRSNSSPALPKPTSAAHPPTKARVAAPVASEQPHHDVEVKPAKLALWPPTSSKPRFPAQPAALTLSRFDLGRSESLQPIGPIAPSTRPRPWGMSGLAQAPQGHTTRDSVGYQAAQKVRIRSLIDNFGGSTGHMTKSPSLEDITEADERSDSIATPPRTSRANDETPNSGRRRSASLPGDRMPTQEDEFRSPMGPNGLDNFENYPTPILSIVASPKCVTPSHSEQSESEFDRKLQAVQMRIQSHVQPRSDPAAVPMQEKPKTAEDPIHGSNQLATLVQPSQLAPARIPLHNAFHPKPASNVAPIQTSQSKPCPSSVDPSHLPQPKPPLAVLVPTNPNQPVESINAPLSVSSSNDTTDPFPRDSAGDSSLAPSYDSLLSPSAGADEIVTTTAAVTTATSTVSQAPPSMPPSAAAGDTVITDSPMQPYFNDLDLDNGQPPATSPSALGHAPVDPVPESNSESETSSKADSLDVGFGVVASSDHGDEEVVVEEAVDAPSDTHGNEGPDDENDEFPDRISSAWLAQPDTDRLTQISSTTFGARTSVGGDFPNPETVFNSGRSHSENRDSQMTTVVHVGDGYDSSTSNYDAAILNATEAANRSIAPRISRHDDDEVATEPTIVRIPSRHQPVLSSVLEVSQEPPTPGSHTPSSAATQPPGQLPHPEPPSTSLLADADHKQDGAAGTGPTETDHEGIIPFAGIAYRPDRVERTFVLNKVKFFDRKKEAD